MAATASRAIVQRTAMRIGPGLGGAMAPAPIVPASTSTPPTTTGAPPWSAPNVRRPLVVT